MDEMGKETLPATLSSLDKDLDKNIKNSTHLIEQMIMQYHSQGLAYNEVLCR